MSMKPTVSRRSRAHVENSPPPEKLNSNKKSLARNIFILKTTKRKAVPLSSKRGTPPFKIYYIGRVIAPREAYIIASQTLNYSIIQYSLFIIHHSLANVVRITIGTKCPLICHLPFAICHFKILRVGRKL